MDIGYFFRGLKGDDSRLLSELDEIRKKRDLDKLYLIYADADEIVWGMRGVDADYENLTSDLSEFIKKHAQIDYLSADKNFSIITNEEKEVAFVLQKQIIPYIESHEGKIEVLEIDEQGGVIYVSLQGACGGCSSAPITLKLGIENTLKGFLPWVKSVIGGKRAVNAPTAENGYFSLTENAAKKIKAIVNEKNFGIAGGIRIGVIPGGCSGFQYEFTAIEKAEEGDQVFVKEFTDGKFVGAGRVFLNRESLKFLLGATLDYGKTGSGFAEDFIVINPNQKSSCGCGKSVEF